MNACNNKDGTVISKKVKNKSESAPLLYNATGLQMEAGVKLGWGLDKTVKIMQELYEHKYMSYPRTSSEHLTVEMQSEVATTIDKLMNLPEYIQYALPKNHWLEFSKRHFDNEKVGSHTAIIPTTTVPKDLSELSADGKLLYDLLVKSLLRIVYPKVQIEETALEINVNGNIFKANGSVIKNNGWYDVDALPEKKAILPGINEGQTLKGTYQLVEGVSEPPKRYTETSLIGAMELAGQKLEDEEARTLMKMQKKGLGTDATRAVIIKGLFDKGYIQKKGKSIIPTEKGTLLIDVLAVDDLKSAETTGEWEKHLHEIEIGKTSYDSFISEIKSTTNKWFEQIKNSTGQRYVSESEKKMLCPICGNTIFKGKFGYSCAGYKQGCKFQIKYDICGKKITENQALTLLEKGRTSVIKGFISKSGAVFDAALKVNKDKMGIEFEFTK